GPCGAGPRGRRRRPVLLDDRPATPVAGAGRVRLRAAAPTQVAGTPALPQKEREQEPHEADDHQDPADDIYVDRGTGALVDRERQDRPTAIRMRLTGMPTPLYARWA